MPARANPVRTALRQQIGAQCTSVSRDRTTSIMAGVQPDHSRSQMVTRQTFDERLQLTDIHRLGI